MAEPRYLQIAFDFVGAPKVSELQPTFDRASDWVRIANNAWIIWTSNTPEVWHKRLKPLLSANDNIYIFGIDNDSRSGWAPEWVWKWLDKKR